MYVDVVIFFNESATTEIYTFSLYFVLPIWIGRSHVFFFFNDTAPTEIYTLSLHDALPICPASARSVAGRRRGSRPARTPPVCAASRPPPLPGPGRHRAGNRDSRSPAGGRGFGRGRSEEHTSELQSPCNLVCRLLLEKKKNI